MGQNGIISSMTTTLGETKHEKMFSSYKKSLLMVDSQ
jgi:hypothetical protein